MWTPLLRLAKKLVSLAILGLAVYSCDKSASVDPSNTPSGSALTGTVLDKSGKGIANVAVRLKSSGQSVSTDQNGRWKISVPSSRAARSQSAIDSVQFSKDSQYIATQAVSSYQEELPPLYIVQRDISGALAGPSSGVAYTITAYLTLPDSTVKSLTLWHNSVAHAFSGFIYTTQVDAPANYSVRVVVRAAEDSSITGLSPVVPFNSTAGDVVIPVFSYNNVKPTASLTVTGTVKFGNTIRLVAALGDTDIAVNGTMETDSVKNTVQWYQNGKWVNVVNARNGFSRNITLDTSILKDSCFQVRVLDDQDTSIKAENKICFDKTELFQSTVTSRTAAMWTSTTGLFAANPSTGVVDYRGNMIGDSAKRALGLLTDRIVNLSAGANDTVDVGWNDRNNKISVRTYDLANEKYNYETRTSTKRSITHVHLDSFGFGAAVNLVEMKIWSATAAKVVIFNDTVNLKVGDNQVFVNRNVTDTSKVVLRIMPYTNGYETSMEPNGKYMKWAVFTSLGWFDALGMYAVDYKDIPAGTQYAPGGIFYINPANLERDWNPISKFVLKSVVGYRY